MKKKSEIVKGSGPTLIQVAVDRTMGGIKTLAELASAKDLAPDQVARLFALSKVIGEAVVKSIEPVLKDRVVRLLKERGTQVTEGGSRAATIDGWKLFMKPHRTGLEAKKVEGLLRAKGVRDMELYMTPDISYKVSEAGILKAVEEGLLTRDELESCRYRESWAVEVPTIAEESK